MKILGIIPARLASTRFPEKALADIGGKTMIQRVYEQASKASSLSSILVATDHEKIYHHVLSFGGNVVMTSEKHQSGTDRCLEALDNHLKSSKDKLYDFIINIQGDEPFIQPEQINLLASVLKVETQVATLAKKITDSETLFSSNTPKLIMNEANLALYFSRQTIPFIRGIPKENWLDAHTFFNHVGIYAYRTDVLRAITKFPISSLEKAESLEQLRWLENGISIHVGITDHESIGIDTPEDLDKVKGMF